MLLTRSASEPAPILLIMRARCALTVRSVVPIAAPTCQGAWQVGPAFGAIYTGVPGLLVGFVLLNPVSFTYTSRDRAPQNTLEVQPVLAFHLWDGWYLRSAEANWTMGWHRHSPTTLPLSLGIGRTFVHRGLPPMSFFITGQWTLYRQFALITPQTTVNFGMTIAFPGLRRW